MESIPFGAEYANYYDLLYSDKDYEAECDYILKLFRKYSRRNIRSILDIACGTGGHALILAQRGYHVKATDASYGMLSVARRKSSGQANIAFEHCDMRQLRISRKFDACICMFTALGYVTQNSELKSVFENVARSLRSGGVFVFDVWYGPSVLSQGARRSKKQVKGRYRIIRQGVPTLNHLLSMLEMKFHVRVLSGSRTVNQFRETHRLRYFFVTELKDMMESAGLKLASVHPFMHPGRGLGLKDWNATFVATRQTSPHREPAARQHVQRLQTPITGRYPFKLGSDAAQI